MAVGPGRRSCLATDLFPEAVGAQDDAGRASVQAQMAPQMLRSTSWVQ